jgi:hypothetical protein
VFSFRSSGAQCQIGAHRFAYERKHETLSLGTRYFPICHLCSFGPCCNPSHLVIGSAYDNAQDRRVPLTERVIILPDRRVWCYAQAYYAQRAFYEAWQFQHVWAGPVPYDWQYLEMYINHPDKKEWPGRFLAQKGAIAAS